MQVSFNSYMPVRKTIKFGHKPVKPLVISREEAGKRLEAYLKSQGADFESLKVISDKCIIPDSGYMLVNVKTMEQARTVLKVIETSPDVTDITGKPPDKAAEDLMVELETVMKNNGMRPSVTYSPFAIMLFDMNKGTATHHQLHLEEIVKRLPGATEDTSTPSHYKLYDYKNNKILIGYPGDASSFDYLGHYGVIGFTH